MEDKILDGFRRDFLSIKSKGFVESHRTHNTGIGQTFEDLLGIVENNNSLADYKGLLEIKSSRELSESMITLFTKSPTFPKNINSTLREKYGQSDSKADGMKTLHTTLSSSKFNTFVNKFGFKLSIYEEKNRMLLLIMNLATGKLEDIEVYYDFSILKEIVEKKCKYIAYIKAETKNQDGKEFFSFKNAVLLSGLTFEKFIQCVKEGIILYDIRIGVYRSGKDKGKTHDHGSGFRVLKNNLDRVFSIEEI